MSNSTQWHKHEDGVWHKRNSEFYNTMLGEPFNPYKVKEKSMLKTEAGGQGSRGWPCL